MPKIIENLENKLIEETRKQIHQQGYSAVTIRSIASACGVGVGTVYNYFPSKDDLLAAYMLKDWNTCVTAIRAVSTYAETFLAVCRCIYDQLQDFTRRYQDLFQDPAARASFGSCNIRYHGVLRGQLAQSLERFCGSGFASEFVAEALLTWTVEGKPFEEVYGMLERLL